MFSRQAIRCSSRLPIFKFKLTYVYNLYVHGKGDISGNLVQFYTSELNNRTYHLAALCSCVYLSIRFAVSQSIYLI